MNKPIWVRDLGNGNYKNPILHTDYSDPDIVKVNDDYFMTASSFNNVPGLPILHSKDLVNWKLVNYAIKEIPFEGYDKPQYGKAVWAPAIRYHDGYFYIYVGFPDEGIMMVRTKDPYGEWDKPVCLKQGRGYIDTCPLWDDDGEAYLVHAFARSRIGFKSVIAVNKMTPDGTALTDEFRIVYDGNRDNPTIEGPKFYKHNGYYYISAPAGGVKTGWQLILRSKNVYGPYEEKIVLAQGSTDVNGPHQGGWVDINDEESWFVHFQDKDAYGRIVHLQPMRWVDDWPEMGVNAEPVIEYKKPNLPVQEPMGTMASDDFEGSELNINWQWNANPGENWYSLEARKGFLRLYGKKIQKTGDMPNILTQKFPAPAFTAAVDFELSAGTVGEAGEAGEAAGLVVLGSIYRAIQLIKTQTGYAVQILEGRVSETEETVEYTTISCPYKGNKIYIKVQVYEGAVCQFFYSTDGRDYCAFGEKFKAETNRWVGAKVGIYMKGVLGYADSDKFLIEE